MIKLYGNESEKMQHILSLSYGKDSLACLEAIKLLGWPLDRIVHAEVWATDTIPADLPPMVEFKRKADEIIKKRYGITVEHICAMTGGGKNSHTRKYFTNNSRMANTLEEFMDFQLCEEHGATQNLKCSHSIPSQKITYQSLFYKKTKSGKFKGMIRGFPGLARMGRSAWCTGELKITPMNF